MSFTVIDAPHRSEAWFKARAGRLTGSVAKEMLAKLKDGKPAKISGSSKNALNKPRDFCETIRRSRFGRLPEAGNFLSIEKFDMAYSWLSVMTLR